jgi:hypothetical protein
MAKQHTTSKAPESQVAALFGSVLFSFYGDPLGEASAHFSHLICALTGELLKFAPSVILAGCHALGNYIFAHQ